MPPLNPVPPTTAGRRALPRFATTVTLDLEVAGVDEADALRVASVLVDRLRPALEARVRNHAGRTARLLAVTVDPQGLGPDAMARQ